MKLWKNTIKTKLVVVSEPLEDDMELIAFRKAYGTEVKIWDCPNGSKMYKFEKILDRDFPIYRLSEIIMKLDGDNSINRAWLDFEHDCFMLDLVGGNK